MEHYCPYYTNRDRSHTADLILICSLVLPCFSFSCCFIKGNQNARFKGFKMPSEFNKIDTYK